VNGESSGRKEFPPEFRDGGKSLVFSSFSLFRLPGNRNASAAHILSIYEVNGFKSARKLAFKLLFTTRD